MTMRVLLAAAALGLVLATAPAAETIDAIRVGRGVWEECLAGCTTGAKSRVLQVGGLRRLRVWCAVETGVFNANAEFCIESSPAACDANGTWGTEVLGVCGSTPLSVTSPMGWLRLNVDICTGCTYRVEYAGALEVHE